MPGTEGQTFGVCILALDAKGEPAASARDANTVYVSWFISNLTGHPLKLSFPKGQLFKLTLLGDDGAILWQSGDAPPGQDFQVTVNPDGNFSIPVDPPAAGLAQQVPMIPLADVIKAKQIPSTKELDASMTVLLSTGAQSTSARLWRTQ